MFINNETCYIFDEPAKFKDLIFYPVTVRDSLEFNTYVNCLLIDKNSIADVRIISMSYLEYLLEATNTENFYYSKLILLLRLCLRLKKVLISEEQAKINYELGKNVLISKTTEEDKDSITVNNQKNISWNKTVKLVKKSIGEDVYYFEELDRIEPVIKDDKLFIRIKDSFYTTSDFDKIRKIILEQNDVEQFDEKVNKSVRDSLEKKQKIANKIRGTVKFCDFEEQMICVSIALSISLEEVKNMTLRKFQKYIPRINHKLDYEILTVAYAAGGVDGKKTPYPEHWMSDLTQKNKYAGIIMGEDELKDKVK